MQLDKRGERKYRKRPVLCAVSARYFVISLRNQGNSETLQQKTEEFLYDFYDSGLLCPPFSEISLLNVTSFRFLACEPEVDGSRMILHDGDFYRVTVVENFFLNIAIFVRNEFYLLVVYPLWLSLFVNLRRVRVQFDAVDFFIGGEILYWVF